MFTRTCLFATLALSLALFVGCDNKTQAERDSLLQQNRDLKSQMDAQKAELEAKERELAAARSSVTTTPAGGGATTPGMTDVPPVETTATDPTLKGEAGVTFGKNKAGETQIELASDVFFDPGKATLKPSAKKALDRVAALIKKNYAGQSLRIEGHTDPTPVGKSGWKDNYALGAGRATAVMNYLASQGVAKSSMHIVSKAATEPKSKTDNSKNRRVEIIVVKNGK